MIGDRATQSRRDYEKRKQEIQRQVRGQSAGIRLSKGTTSHTFRYDAPTGPARRTVSMAVLRHVLDLDVPGRTIDVEGGTPYQEVVRQTLAHDLLPAIAPELKGITVGGALAGIGIESAGFRYGFVHDGVEEVEVLLPSGDVVICTPDNAHADLFAALPNSYGTLGYVLRARLTLISAAPFVRVVVRRYRNVDAYLTAMFDLTTEPGADFVEGLMYSPAELYVISGAFVQEAPAVASIHGPTPYYRLLRDGTDLCLAAEDYIFRYDPDWFWNVPEGGIYSIFRAIAPRSMRASEFYKQYMKRWAPLLARLRGRSRNGDGTEQLIQDWEVPWPHAAALVKYALEHVDLKGRPWAAVPVRPLRAATLYPAEPGCLYFNLGCYCWIDRPPGTEPYYATKILDAKCFELGGIKMLYSSTFCDEAAFDRVYNGDAYRALKTKYDPGRRLPTLYQKAAGRA
jgi:FAD/FMN-containing dehydrogenase